MSKATQVVAIDGPAGAGKSSAARRAATELGFSFLDTGAMYRAATWWALQQRIDLENAPALAEATRGMQLDLVESDKGLQVSVNGTDITAAIRTPEVTRVIYKLDQNSEVRKHLVMLQRQFGERRPTVAEGRDIGTVVFPCAKCKIYMDASIEVRAGRRAKELLAKGLEVNMDNLRKEIQERDHQSMTRQDSPLRPAEDAVHLDTSSLTLEEVVARIVALAREKLML